MKEYDDDKAVELMTEALNGKENVESDDVYQVLDLIFDYYEESGELEIDAEGDDTDVEAMIDFIVKHLKKNAPSCGFSREDIAAMAQAEMAYEESLL